MDVCGLSSRAGAGSAGCDERIRRRVPFVRRDDRLHARRIAPQGVRALRLAVARKGADLASYGKVAELIPTPSILKLGLEGRYSGAPRFTLVAVSSSITARNVDEWLMGFDNGSMAWLSESQGSSTI